MSALQWVELLRSSTGKRCLIPELRFAYSGLFTYKSFGLFFTSYLQIPSCHRAIHPIRDEAIVIFACLMPSLGSTNDKKRTSLCPPPPAPSKGGELWGTLFVIFACLMPSLRSYNDKQKKHPPAPFKGGTGNFVCHSVPPLSLLPLRESDTLIDY